MNDTLDEFDLRLDQWMAGELEDWELTDADLIELEQRVNGAIARKMLAVPGVHIFPEHPTLQ